MGTQNNYQNQPNRSIKLESDLIELQQKYSQAIEDKNNIYNKLASAEGYIEELLAQINQLKSQKLVIPHNNASSLPTEPKTQPPNQQNIETVSDANLKKQVS